MAKEVAGQLKLQIKGGAANPSPPVGPALGSKGINIMGFCKGPHPPAPAAHRRRSCPCLLQHSSAPPV